MQIKQLADYHKGWFLGNFEPSLLKTESFEASIMRFKKDEYVAPHTHRIATEYNVLIEGKMSIQNTIINRNEIFILEPYEITDPIYLEDCTLLVIKVPSVPGDKYDV